MFSLDNRNLPYRMSSLLTAQFITDFNMGHYGGHYRSSSPDDDERARMFSAIISNYSDGNIGP